MAKRAHLNQNKRENNLHTDTPEELADRTFKLKKFVGEYVNRNLEEFETRMNKLDDKNYTEKFSKLLAFYLELEHKENSKPSVVNIGTVQSMTWNIVPVPPKERLEDGSDTIDTIDITPDGV